MGNKTGFVVLDSLQAIILNQAKCEKEKLKHIKKHLAGAPSKAAHYTYLTIKDKKWQRTPIQCAAEQGLWGIFEYLEKKGAVYERDCNERNLVHHAAFHLNFELTNKLLDSDSSLAKQVDKDKLLPIQYAFTNGKVKFITFFQTMSPRLFPNYPNQTSTPLHTAVHDDDEQRVASLLVTLPNLVNITDESGQSPLHLAIKLCNVRMAKILSTISGIDKSLRDMNNKTAYELLLELKNSAQGNSIEYFDELVKRLQPQTFSAQPLKRTESKSDKKLTSSSKEISKLFKKFNAGENNITSSDSLLFDSTLSSPKTLDLERMDSRDELSISSLSFAYTLNTSKSRNHEKDHSGEETFRDFSKDIVFTQTPRTPKLSRQYSKNTRQSESEDHEVCGANLPFNEFPQTPLAAFKSGSMKLFKQFMVDGRQLEFDFKDTQDFIDYFANSPVFFKMDPWRPLQQMERELRFWALNAYNKFAKQQQTIEAEFIRCLKKHGIGKETEISSLSNLPYRGNNLLDTLYLLCRRLSFNSSSYTLIILGLLEEYDGIDILTQLCQLMPTQSKSEQLIAIYLLKELIIWDDRQNIVSNSIFDKMLTEENGLRSYLEYYEVYEPIKKFINDKTEFKASPFELYRLFSDAFQGELTRELMSIDYILSTAVDVVNPKSKNQKSQEAYNILRSELQRVGMTTYRNAFADEFRQKNTSKLQSNQVHAPHIKYSQDMTNGLVYYFVDKILDCKSNSARCNMIFLLILLANDLLKENNYLNENQELGPDLTTGSAIMAALNHHAIDRLKTTWKLVNSNSFYQETYISLQKTFTYDNNYARLRALQNTSSSPIPFICIFFRDIIYFKDRKHTTNKASPNDLAKYYEDIGTIFYYIRTLKRNLTFKSNIPRTNLSSELKRVSRIDQRVLEIKTLKIEPRALKLTHTTTPDFINTVTFQCKAGIQLEIFTNDNKKMTGIDALNKLHLWTKKLIKNGKLNKEEAHKFIVTICDSVSCSGNIKINQAKYLNDLNVDDENNNSILDTQLSSSSNRLMKIQNNAILVHKCIFDENSAQSKIDCMTYLQEDSSLEKESKIKTRVLGIFREQPCYPSIEKRDSNEIPSEAWRRNISGHYNNSSGIPSWQASGNGTIGRQFVISHYRKSRVLSVMMQNSSNQAFSNLNMAFQDTKQTILSRPKGNEFLISFEQKRGVIKKSSSFHSSRNLDECTKPSMDSPSIFKSKTF